ncbi:MAG: hypothetical protein AAFX58_00610 [Pseudomonadota bacterium]
MSQIDASPGAARAGIPALLASAFVLGGCAVAKVEKQYIEAVELNVAGDEVAEDRLLDIGIVEFSPGLKEGERPEDFVYPDIRRAEARYMPYHLKSTLERSGYWGAVRVLPSSDAFTDLYIRGEIVESDGETVAVRYSVADATGRSWLARSYTTRTGRNSYAERRDRVNDPYQNVYNEFANDLQALLSEASDTEVAEIRTVSELRFMEDLAPRVFDGYLAEDRKGRLSIERLPADNDPMADRLRRVRERDQLFIDTLNEHYANFYYGIALPYEGWRKAAREEILNYKELRRSALIRQIAGVVVLAGALAADTSNKNNAGGRAERAIQHMVAYSGLEAIKSGFGLRAEANLHKESISELADSFSSEATPMVVNVRGETRRLTGTAEAQYEQWRKLLHEIYAAETGFGSEVELSVPVREPLPTG